MGPGPDSREVITFAIEASLHDFTGTQASCPPETKPRAMKVLSVASECVPFVKTGGLADVAGALPGALAPLGVEMRVLMPGYPAVKAALPEDAEARPIGRGPGGRARVISARAAGIDVMVLDSPRWFERPGNPYLGPDGRDWPDNHLRFGALCRAAARIATAGFDGWRPDVVHLHDWQAGLTAAWLKLGRKPAPPSLLTIHNIAFQGLFPPEATAALELPESGFHPEGFEFFGQVGFLKAGLVYANRISTVSPTYARELTRPAFGMGLEGVIASRRAEVHGILNGIDLDVWNPERDPHLTAHFSARAPARKAGNRTALCQRLGLRTAPGERLGLRTALGERLGPRTALGQGLGSRTALGQRLGLHAAGEGPLFCVISRLARQKGLDLLLEALPRLLARGASLALLGSGEPDLEHAFQTAAADHPGRVGVVIGYDEPLSHLMQAGADAILVPSRFEPCGLTQLYGLRYGTLPVVTRTGGLADTVIDANDAALRAGVATGFQCAPGSAASLADAIDRACDAFADRKLWSAMVRRAMRHPVGWGPSAAAYAELYSELLDSAA